MAQDAATASAKVGSQGAPPPPKGTRLPVSRSQATTQSLGCGAQPSGTTRRTISLTGSVSTKPRGRIAAIATPAGTRPGLRITSQASPGEPSAGCQPSRQRKVAAGTRHLLQGGRAAPRGRRRRTAQGRPPRARHRRPGPRSWGPRRGAHQVIGAARPQPVTSSRAISAPVSQAPPTNPPAPATRPTDSDSRLDLPGTSITGRENTSGNCAWGKRLGSVPGSPIR